MTDKQLDDLFKKRLYQHSSSVPDDMWIRIAGDNKKRKEFFLPRSFLIFLLLLITFFTSWYFIIYKNGNHKSEITSTVYPKQQANNTKNSDTKKIAPRLSFLKKHPFINNKLIFLTIENRELNKTNKRYHQKQKETINYATIKNRMSNKENATGNNAEISENNKDVGAGNPKNKDKDFDSLTAQYKIGLKDLNDTVKEDIKESFNDRIAIELYVSPQLPVSNINSSNIDYANMLKSGSAARLSFNLGARFTVSITELLSAKIGVLFNQVNEKVTFKERGQSTNSEYNNHYKSIDVPLLLTYKLPGESLLHKSFSAGIILNIHSSYTGAIPSVSSETLSLNNTNVYNRNTGVSFYGSASLSKRVSNKLNVFAEPYLRFPIKSMTGSFQSFTQRINTSGVSFGLRYNLFSTINKQ